MSYYFKAVDVLLEKFNVANKLNLLPGHVKFINPRPADSVDITMSKVYNTAIDMVMQPGAPFNGVVTLYYNRVDLRVEFSNAKLSENNYVNIEKETTLHEALDAINVKLGTRLTANEVEDMELPAISLLVPVQLRATDDSFEYFGAVDLTLYRSSAKRATVDHELGALGFYEKAARSGITNKPFIPLYHKTMHLDYTSARAVLSKLKPTLTGVMFKKNAYKELRTSGYRSSYGDSICAALFNHIDGLGWRDSTDSTAEYSSNNSVTCIYNGPTTDLKIPTHVDYGFHVMRMTMPDGFEEYTNPANLNYKYVAVFYCNSTSGKNNTVGKIALMHYN